MTFDSQPSMCQQRPKKGGWDEDVQVIGRKEGRDDEWWRWSNVWLPLPSFHSCLYLPPSDLAGSMTQQWWLVVQEAFCGQHKAPLYTMQWNYGQMNEDLFNVIPKSGLNRFASTVKGHSLSLLFARLIVKCPGSYCINAHGLLTES